MVTSWIWASLSLNWSGTNTFHQQSWPSFGRVSSNADH